MEDRSALDQLRAEVQELREEVRKLRAERPRKDRQRATRRGALAMAAGGAIAATLGAAKAADAADGDSFVVGSSSNVADQPTGLEVNGTTAAYGVGVTDNGLGSLPTVYPAVFGHARDANFVTGVFGYVTSDGVGCEAIQAVNDVNGSSATLANHAGNAVAAYAKSAAAVYANSALGRGIVSATSKIAQLQLTPGSQATHPKAGQAGDFFVDNSARLWFCKVGGTTATWKQIA